MSKCRFCMPSSKLGYMRIFQANEDCGDTTKDGNPITCGNNTFPGYEFCPRHLENGGVDLTKLTADYIANKEE